jgi:hypothetical protein
MSWKARLSHPIGHTKPTKGTLETLHDARAYILELGERGQWAYWQGAIRELMGAEESGKVEAATRQLQFALLMNGALKLSDDLPTEW